MKSIPSHNGKGFQKDPRRIATVLRSYLFQFPSPHAVIFCGDEFIAVQASGSDLVKRMCSRHYFMGTYDSRVSLPWLIEDIQEALKST